ncbi:UPF0545 protein C22orf39 homolog [Cotesia glomerata]|uniref:Synaptic plasticity regulator PANTS n=1 Tax=Cotesia glomerata TaxID=32391 RepID=A0AAV7IZX0_COTGL|nr:UPF0545 protein C22orf39 homolog [Cotesia glomerata]XP_044585776.1 UPF0545 protein C22orf39 homolog [Cotesia glomerata]XP_044585777.1 UPF0545 protein C22orf39 homolog [Cotesia glomerata]KAH0561429.1 hypothetical protein KQX54_016735 [Cotesia glomerata]
MSDEKKWDEHLRKIQKPPEKKEEKVPEKQKDDSEKPEERIWEGDWMLKPCYMYEEDYKDCTSVRGRFYQNFIYGEQLDCTQYKTDYLNCKKWKKNDDEAAYNNLIESVKKRRMERLKPHLANDVWTKRGKPPADWSEPLPEWMVKKNEGTFLASKQKNIDIMGYDNNMDLYVPSCTIL